MREPSKRIFQKKAKKERLTFLTENLESAVNAGIAFERSRANGQARPLLNTDSLLRPNVTTNRKSKHARVGSCEYALFCFVWLLTVESKLSRSYQVVRKR